MDVEADELNMLPAELDVKSLRLNCLDTIGLDRKTKLVKELKALVRARKEHNATLATQIDAL
jgi:hypothetical protein